MNKKLFGVILTLLLIVVPLLIPQQASAQGTWWSPTFKEFADKVGTDVNLGGSADNEIFGERYTLAQVNWIMASLAMSQAGDLIKCFGDNPVGGSVDACLKQLTTMSSPILFLARMNDTLLSSHPASGVDYVASRIQKLNPVQQAYAQEGFGYKTLAPLQDIWIAVRNLSLGLMSFVIIVLAFMIMFRQKISAQAVITAQSALPKVVIALIFITFSYAIAGFLVDLSYVVMGVVSLVLAQSGLIASPNIVNIFTNLNNPLSAFESWTGILGAFLLVGAGVSFVTGGFGVIIGAVSAFIAVILLALGLVAFFRIFITMLKAFTTLVFLIIGSPLIGLMSVLSAGPGVGGWAKQIIAQLSVFVGICISLMLAHMIFWTMGAPSGALAQILSGGANYYNFTTGAIGSGNILFPGFSGFSVQLLSFFIGFGILFSAPKIATGLRDQIATGRGSYGFDTWGVIAGPVAGLTAASYSGGKKLAGRELAREFNQSRAGTAVTESVERISRGVGSIFGGRGGGRRTPGGGSDTTGAVGI